MGTFLKLKMDSTGWGHDPHPYPNIRTKNRNNNEVNRSDNESKQCTNSNINRTKIHTKIALLNPMFFSTIANKSEQ